jgi:glucose/arabinose dehydrogenase
MVRRGIRGIPAILALLLQAAPAAAQLHSTQFVSGLTNPVAFVQDPSDATVQYVVQQGGRIRVVHNGTLQSTDFLNVTSSIVSGGEQGLLGLAFAPDYATSGRFFVNFNNPNGDLVVARFKRATTTPSITADPASRFDLRWSTGLRVIQHPSFANHNSTTPVFGPDGYLYISTGDGGSGDDPNNNAQNMSSLLGKMLRIDVSVPDSDANGFAIPPSNPFILGARPEVWDVGLRNPWRYSFDDPAHGGTGALVIGDVGQNRFEEIDYEPRGTGAVNYGWRIREGAHDEVTTLPPAFLPLTDPVFEYPHTVGHAIIGGYVYRGTALGSGMVGRYFFADNVDRRLWSLALTVNPATGLATASDLREHTSELSPGDVSSFGVDAAGELYYCNYSAGTIQKITSLAPPPPSIAAVTPSSGSTLGATGVTITGANFQNGALVGFGGLTATSVVFSSATTLTAITPAHALGTVDVLVRNPDLQSATATGAFTYTNYPIAPFGSFDTPLNGTTGLAGSLAVTGWALDDVQVARVTICRDYPAGSSGPLDPNCNTQSQIYIGDAVFIGGARPDVQAAFPSAPLSGRAGWGYLLLTNVLPNLTNASPRSGNGTFTLRAYAYDVDGHVAPLGAKTVSINNSGSLLPFGAIDTPAQGASVAGTVPNFGWVLSPGTGRSDPPGGGSVQVLIDGTPVGSPAGWTSRSDLTSLFPQAQYSGVTTALGVFGLDTTKLTNGLHTIAWVITDNLGAQQGIGSRFFTVSNGAVVGGSAALRSENSTAAPAFRPAGAGRSIYGRTGYDVDTPRHLFAPDAAGRIVVTIQELGRVELDVNAANGYLLTPAGRAALPAGSRIDPSTGTFTWQPGAGFLGVFDLVFDDLRVRIVITPRH